jgi:hypothetical protein
MLSPAFFRAAASSSAFFRPDLSGRLTARHFLLGQAALPISVALQPVPLF